MRKCPKCGAEMRMSAIREYVPDHSSYGCDVKRVVVGRWYICDKCDMREYEKVM
jgi:predicted nucleic-acid-binding Zn-ribbon protein